MQSDKNALAQAVEHLRRGDLDSAHKIAQEHEGDPLADTLHAVIHRREGDYSNSLYWWRRVGENAPAQLAALYGGDPESFVRRCQAAAPGSTERQACDRLERDELDTLVALFGAPSHA